jgi:hypothetical protein
MKRTIKKIFNKRLIRGVTILEILPQTGTRKSLHADRMRKALPSGKRISSSGNVYYETRRNRSDLIGKNI